MMISLISASATANRVEIFTTQAHPVQFGQQDALYCELDVLDQLTESLALKFKAGSNAIVFDPKAKQELRKAYDCLHKAQEYALDYLPAIVINGSYVAYGLDSVDQAYLVLREQRGVVHG